VKEVNEVTRARTVVGAAAKAAIDGVCRDLLWGSSLKLYRRNDKSIS